MCTTCGCGTDEVKIDGKAHSHGHGPSHSHAAGVPAERAVAVERDILAKNDEHASANRRWFADRGMFVLNLVSSPGPARRRCWCAPWSRSPGAFTPR